jgi:hypothetical protein
VVNGTSLFVATKAAERDLCGCFSPDYAKSCNVLVRGENARLETLFTFGSPTLTRLLRVPLFICAECGDLACGAITLQLVQCDQLVLWVNFAFENGFDDTQSNFHSFAGIGPFEFDCERYAEIICKQHPLLRRNH